MVVRKTEEQQIRADERRKVLGEVAEEREKERKRRKNAVICRRCGDEMFWHNGFWHCNSCHT